MYRKGSSNKSVLLLPLVLLAAFMVPIALSCKGETSVEETPTATGADLLQDPVKVEGGYIAGTVVGEPGKEVRAYRGIPYAAPPVGDLRWKPPQPVQPWSGIREATVFSKKCAQGQAGWVGGDASEDCLYLNVFTPAKKAGERLPVMVWLHGGSFATGSANSVPYVWPSLPQHGVVLVGINHRLGPLGLLALPELSAESSNGVSGNYMFLDLIAGLNWVQANIAAFGGDPTNVTIFGESGGSAKTDALIASPLAAGLFQRAILESGANFEGSGGRGVLPLKQAEALGRQLVAKLGIPDDGNVLAALRATPYERILETAAAIGAPGDAEAGVLNSLVVDGWFMPDTPTNVYKAGKQNDISLLTCATQGELTVGSPGPRLSHGLNGYLSRLTAVSESGNKAYAALFSQVPSTWKGEGVMAFHGLELPYVFGMLAVVPHPVFYETFAHPAGAQSQDPGLTEDDQQVSEAMMSVWAQFARTGDPTVEGLVLWPAWDPTSDRYLEIGWPLGVRSGYSKVVPAEGGGAASSAAHPEAAPSGP